MLKYTNNISQRQQNFSVKQIYRIIKPFKNTYTSIVGVVSIRCFSPPDHFLKNRIHASDFGWNKWNISALPDK